MVHSFRRKQGWTQGLFSSFARIYQAASERNRRRTFVTSRSVDIPRRFMGIDMPPQPPFAVFSAMINDCPCTLLELERRFSNETGCRANVFGLS